MSAFGVKKGRCVMFRIWICNLGKYNEGELEGEWVDLPCDDLYETLGGVYERIGINDKYEETFIADYDNDYGYAVGEYDDLDYLNEIAEELEALPDYECDVWESLHDGGYNHDEIMDIIRYGDYITYGNCIDMGDVAMLAYEMSGQLAEIEKVMPSYYVDWDSIGRDMDIEGKFYPCGDGFVEVLR